MPKPALTLFYATIEDLAPGLKELEARLDLRYVRQDLSPSPDIVTYERACNLPDIGLVPNGSSSGRRHYLVLRRDAIVQTRAVPQRRRGVLFAVDEVANPSAMIFVPGGMFGDECLIVGECMGTSDPRSSDLHRQFQRHALAGFSKRKLYFVGPEAMRLHESGVRLTHDRRARPEYDLKL